MYDINLRYSILKVGIVFRIFLVERFYIFRILFLFELEKKLMIIIILLLKKYL